MGCNLPLAINDALTRSDYYLLLWSRHAVDRPWVDSEWSAAFMQELSRRRSFLFVVKLDRTPMPTLLASRKYLDLGDDEDAVIRELVAVWNRDRGVGTRVLPAPGPGIASAADGDRPIELYLRNRALGVSFTVAVPKVVTAKRLWDLVRNGLELPDREAMFGGRVGMRFGYELLAGDERIPLDSLAERHPKDGDTIDLLVTVELLTHNQTPATWALRSRLLSQGLGPGGTATVAAGISPNVVRALLDSAFGHLDPR
jgi:hypothetical protein